MWHQLLDGHMFISSLYDTVPDLKNVRINAIKIRDEGQNATIEFDMPVYAETPPSKWAEYNTVFVEVDLIDIYEMSIQSGANRYKGDMKFYVYQDVLHVEIDGSVKGLIKANAGLIQSVRGYING